MCLRISPLLLAPVPLVGRLDGSASGWFFFSCYNLQRLGGLSIIYGCMKFDTSIYIGTQPLR
jgi:hypothetical protein